MRQEKERKEKMTFVDGKSPGKLDMSGKKTFLGVPKSKVSSAPNMGALDKATTRGKDEALIKKG